MLRSVQLHNKRDYDDNIAFRDGDEKETYLNIISNLIPRRKHHTSPSVYSFGILQVAIKDV